ncbi:MAG: hypothetical protein V1800_07900 [Candidatus Latescibacterota bacterium]
MKGLLKAVGFGIFLVLVGTAWGGIVVWSVGNWGDRCLRNSGMDFESIPGSMLARELRPGENVALRLAWKAEKPVDYTVVGTPMVWVPLSAFQKTDFRYLVDGDSLSSSLDTFKSPNVSYYGYPFYFDFGEALLLSGMSFYPRQKGKDERGNNYSDFFMKGYTVRVSDGSNFDSDGKPMWTELKNASSNWQSVVNVGFSPRLIRFVKLTNAAEDAFELAEVEFYGAGFSLESDYFSNIIDLGKKGNFGEVSWDVSKQRRAGDELVAAPDAKVSIVMEGRSGRNLTPEIYFAAGDSVRVTRQEWLALPKIKQGSVKEDRENWSAWYTLGSGGVFPTLGPRRYFQFRSHISGTLTETIRIDDFRLQYAAPLLAEEILGEVALMEEPNPPGRIAEVAPGEQNVFTYDVKARFVSALQKGFDGLRIETPSRPEFLWFVAGGDTITPVVTENPKYLEVLFPSDRITIANNRPIRVILRTAILSYGGELTGYAFDTQVDELPQLIEPGDAHSGVGTNSIGVNFKKKSFGNLLAGLEVSAVITPNGDGANEEAFISYAIAQMDPVFGRAEVRLGIYDTMGRLLRTFPVRSDGNGVYDDAKWDGKDEHGKIVSPGLYLCTISAETDIGTFRETRPVVVVY